MIMRLKRSFLFTLCIGLVLTLFLPLGIKAEEPEEKVVRVGWFESSFCYFDQFGRRRGVDYEYQHKISAYTGWTFEYVEGSWPALLQMLIAGEIDLLSDVSYTPERSKLMLFPDLPMGTESYYIYIDGENREISANNLSSFNGKKIAVNAGSVQEGFLKDWAERNKVKIEIVPNEAEESEILNKLVTGEIDGFATIYSVSNEQNITPVVRIGGSDYFYAVNKDRPDLLADLNMALAGILDEDPYFNQKVSEQRNSNTRTSAFLTPSQEDWVKKHGTIRIGYQDNSSPFCQKDKDSGELTGALKDYIIHATNNLKNSDVQFEAIAYDSTQAAMDALKAGEIDCVFPVNLSTYEANEIGVRLTDPIMNTEMNAVMRASESQGLNKDSTVTFGVHQGDPNIATFIMDKYPNSKIKEISDEREYFESVASKDVDCVLVSNYRTNISDDKLKKLKLFSTPTGESMELSFAVNKEDRDLYFILNKSAVMTRSDDMDAALASYMYIDQKVTLGEFLRDNWFWIIGFTTAVFGVIIFLLLQKLNAERKLNEQQKLMEEALRRELEQKEQLQSAMKMAYTDPLTGVKSKHAYNEAEEELDRRINDQSVKDFSIVVFDLNDLKQINDNRGHEIGDEYIRDACKLICSSFKHSPIFRIGGDEFVAILEGEDYANQEELLKSFEKQILENMKKDATVVAYGCSRFDPDKDKSIRRVFERADAEMYKKKTQLKSLEN